MAFIIDKQTLDDLSIFGDDVDKSIYGLFNHCTTRGGSQILEEMFRSPLNKDQAINKRSAIIKNFVDAKVEFPFLGTSFEAITAYLSNKDERSRLVEPQKRISKRIEKILVRDIETETIYKGISAMVDVLNTLYQFTLNLDAKKLPDYNPEREKILRLLEDVALQKVLKIGNENKFKEIDYYELDKILRFRNSDHIHKIIHFVYKLDAYISISHVSRVNEFSFAKAIDSEKVTLSIEGLYHPIVSKVISKVIPNSISITPPLNVIFLTGANMAGKSTLMKSIGVAMYLAHLGFPVPASSMNFSVRDGLITTINISDNISQGASHFYSEVLRLKKAAQSLKNGHKLFILFDELFRGTNVKDAYDATLEVVRAFKVRTSSLLFLSTHIVEVGEILQKESENILFTYLPTKMKENKPLYTYTLESGITEDRHGMLIINNEKILDILTKEK